jgi:hypothetical protein
MDESYRPMPFFAILEACGRLRVLPFRNGRAIKLRSMDVLAKPGQDC